MTRPGTQVGEREQPGHHVAQIAVRTAGQAPGEDRHHGQGERREHRAVVPPVFAGHIAAPPAAMGMTGSRICAGRARGPVPAARHGGGAMRIMNVAFTVNSESTARPPSRTPLRPQRGDTPECAGLLASGSVAPPFPMRRRGDSVWRY